MRAVIGILHIFPATSPLPSLPYLEEKPKKLKTEEKSKGMKEKGKDKSKEKI